MGLLDSIGSQIANAVSGQQQVGTGNLDIMGLVSNLLNHPETGGLAGLVSTFQSKGLGDIVASWIGTGANLPVSTEQIQSALGAGPLQALATQAGMNTDQMASTLSEHLPGLVDQLTPGGQLPEGNALSAGLGALKGLLG
jgi:uncharacterized protein YidB (DUF937 family)